MNFRKAGLIIFGLLLVSLYIFNRKEIELKPQKPVHIYALGSSGGEIQAIITIKNPNLLSSTIKTIHEKFSINGVLLGIMDNEINQGIPGLKETEFPVSIRFSLTDYKMALALDSLHANNPVITISGDIQYQNLFNSGKIEVHQTTTVTQPSNGN